MKKILLKTALAMCICLFGMSDAYSQQLAFPGAEGFGKYATGGRKGSVYHVTNLNDSGSGSLRDAVSQSNRIVVFDVAGVIKITDRIVVKSNIYIAGQTAPGEGITVYGNGFSFSGANNTICRYLRIRMGKVGTSGADALGIANGSNMIFDHVSVSWGRDETFSISGSDPSNITIQNCIIAQGLQGHSAGGLIQTGSGVSIYRTLYIHNDTRNPKFKGVHQYVNNIVYNWKSAAYIMGGDSEGSSYANAVGNYFITGPSGGKTAFNTGNSKYNIYAEDNWVDNNADGALNGYLIPQSEYSGGPTFQSTPYDYPELPTIPASQLHESLIGSVGANLPYRDNVDWLLIDDLKSLGTDGKFISDEASLPFGAPTAWNMWAGTTTSDDRKDTDGDGMPDWWENANGTNPNANDAMVIGADGYANIERYINSITADNSQYFLKTPLGLEAAERTQSELLLKWLDFTDWEDGYIVEQLLSGTYQEIGRTGKDVNTLLVQGLEANTSYSFRVRAYNATDESGYSSVLTVKTKAVPVDVIDPDTYVPDAVWKGDQSSTWDAVTSNWSSGTFANGNSVLFDATGSGGAVAIASGVETGTVFIKGEKDYTLSGVLAGTGSLNKAGDGTLVLGANNTYSGGTVTWGGTLEISKLANGGVASSIGTAQNWVWNGGKVRYTGGSVSTNREVALENATEFEVVNSSASVTMNGAVSGEGDFIKSGAGSVIANYNTHDYTGNTILRGGTYELKATSANLLPVDIYGKLILEGGRFKTSGGKDGMYGELNFDVEVNGEETSYFQITQYSYIRSKFSGEGNLRLDIDYVREYYRGDWTEFYGTLNVNETDPTKSTASVFMIDNAGMGGIPYARTIVNNRITIRAGSNSKQTVFGALSTASTNVTLGCCQVKTDGGVSTWIVGGLGTDETFAGKITNGIDHSSRIGTTNIVKEGDGYWRLTGANKYRGTTIINGGILIQNGTHVQDKDHTSTYFTPGRYTVNNEGTLAGRGSTEAPVVVKSGGTIAPGDLAIGTFTVKNTVTFEAGSNLDIEVNRTSKTNDRLTATGKMTIAGNLNINLTSGEFANGDAMTILSAASYSGQFANIIPATPAEGLYWDTSSLYTSGVLKVSNALGIESDKNPDLTIKTAAQQIIVEGIQSTELVTVYNLSGAAVFNQRITSSSVEIPVENGLYFVKVGNKTVKVIVK